MDAGTWIALSSAVVSLGAAGIATWQGALARRSAGAARAQAVATRDQAEAAKKALAIQQAQFEQQQQDRQAQRASQARLVTISLDGLGTLVVTVTNNSDQPIRDLVLETVVADESPSSQWAMNANVLPQVAPDVCILPGLQEVRFPVWFTDGDGSIQRLPGIKYTATITFTDSANDRWRRLIGQEPELLSVER